MPKYHINPKTFEVNACRAKIKCQFDIPFEDHITDKREAMRKAEEMIRAERARFLLSPRTPQEVFGFMKEKGYDVVFAKNMKREYYHEFTEGKEPKIGEIRGVSEKNNGMPNKPSGGLWCSVGTPIKDGSIKTDWRRWCSENMSRAHSKDKVMKLKLRDDAVILKLHEYSNLANLNHTINPDVDCWEYMGELDFSSSFENRIDWFALKNAGIDAVLVNGSVERGYFYGWDVDSLVILNGDAVEDLPIMTAANPDVEGEDEDDEDEIFIF